MRSLRSWFAEERASDVAPDYTSQILAQSLAAARGIDGIKSTAAFRGALTLIGHSAAVASLTGQHSGSLQPHLSTIARSMVSTGQSDWLINIGSAGGGSAVARHGVGCAGRSRSAHLGLLADDAGAEPVGDATAARGINSQLQAARRFTNTLDRKARD